MFVSPLKDICMKQAQRVGYGAGVFVPSLVNATQVLNFHARLT